LLPSTPNARPRIPTSLTDGHCTAAINHGPSARSEPRVKPTCCRNTQRVTRPLKPHQEPRSSRDRYCTSRPHLIYPIRSDLPAPLPIPNLRSVHREQPTGRAHLGRADSRLPLIARFVTRLGLCSRPATPWVPPRRNRTWYSVRSWRPRFTGCKARRHAFEVMRPGLAARKA
jgi:hypothetical protein